MNPPKPAPQDDASSQLDLGALWRPIRKYWLTVIAIAVLVTIGAAYWTMRQTKIYEAYGTVQFDPNPPRPLGAKVESVVELGSGAVWDTREYYETQYQVIQSRKVALDVVRAEGLTHDYCFLMMLPATCAVPAKFDDVEEDDAADALRGRLRVDPIKMSRLASVRLQDADPERAARLLKTVMEKYKDQNISNVAESAEAAQKSLRIEHDKLKTELDDSEMALHRYKEQKNLLSVEFDDKSNMLREQIGQLNETMTTLQTRRDEVAARYAEIAKVPADPRKLPASELLSSPVLQNLRQDYITAIRELDALTQSGKGENHPDVLAANARVNASRDAIMQEVQNIQGAIRGELAKADSAAGSAAGRFEKAKKEALELNLLEIEYAQLRRKKENTEKLYSLLLERAKENDLSREFLMNNISIVDYPSAPKGPVKPNVPSNVGAGLAVGLLLGIAAALGRSRLDRTVKTPDDAQIALKANFLGLIPEIDEATARAEKKRHRNAQTGRELYAHHNPMSGIAEAARSVRTNLLFATPDKPFKSLLITSAGANEGKTTVACCIATAMAQANRRVLLVDCDLRRSRLHRIFGLPSTGQHGVTDALLDETLEDYAHPTEVPNLFIVPAGPIPPNPAELLQSERFRGLLARMQARFDLVILDSPPIVPVTDATILSTMVDGTVFVVRAFKTTKDLAKHAGSLLSEVGSRLAGIVLNAVNLQKAEYKYSYRYYKRGDYYSAGGDRPVVSGRSITPGPKAASSQDRRDGAPLS
ncbi:MAG: polysaccharide biosynthesis tyrosine autokinase [Polyangiaceae bacterium]